MLLVILTVFFSAHAQAKGLEFTEMKTTMHITWVTDQKEINKATKKWMREYPEPITALALWDGNNCTIYTKVPKHLDDKYMTLLGHEILHCFRGSFHKD